MSAILDPCNMFSLSFDENQASGILSAVSFSSGLHKKLVGSDRTDSKSPSHSPVCAKDLSATGSSDGKLIDIPDVHLKSDCKMLSVLPGNTSDVQSSLKRSSSAPSLSKEKEKIFSRSRNGSCSNSEKPSVPKAQEGFVPAWRRKSISDLEQVKIQKRGKSISRRNVDKVLAPDTAVALGTRKNQVLNMYSFGANILGPEYVRFSQGRHESKPSSDQYLAMSWATLYVSSEEVISNMPALSTQHSHLSSAGARSPAHAAGAASRRAAVAPADGGGRLRQAPGRLQHVVARLAVHALTRHSSGCGASSNGAAL